MLQFINNLEGEQKSLTSQYTYQSSKINNLKITGVGWDVE